MTASTGARGRWRSPFVGTIVLITAASGLGVSLVARQAAPALTVTIKGSTAYAQPTPVPLATALLVVTPAWEDVAAKSPVGGKEASGQPLFLSDIAVVLSNKPFDCTSAFSARQASADTDIIIVAGRVDAYTATQGYQATPIGKVMLSTSGDAASVAVDRFSIDATFTAQKRKTSSKDGLRGNDGRLALQRDAAGKWTADFMAKADELVAEGKFPLTACSVASRKKAATPPLLGEKRLMNAADRYGM